MRLPLLILHITAGIVGLLSGAVAISFRKGSPRHALAGNVFVISMLCNASAATFLAYMKHQTNNFFGGILSFYMVSTAWATARRPDRRGKSGENGILDWLGFLFAFSIGVLTIMQGVQRATGRIPVDDGVPAFMGFFMGSVILLAALGDLRMLLRGISGGRRIARHLWRMCFGWFIATGSFFMGQQQVFPVWLRGSPVLLVLAVLPLILLIFWMIRVRFTAYRRTFEPSPSAVGS